MDIRTHRELARELCGPPEALGEGTATVAMLTTARTADDEHALVYGDPKPKPKPQPKPKQSEQSQ